MMSGLWVLRAQASQVAYINGDGDVFHCESGWNGRILFSSRVSQTDKFQYGSLTKPVTSAAILLLAKNGRVRLDSSIFDVLVESETLAGFPIYHSENVTVGEVMRHKAGVYGDVFYDKKKLWCPYDVQRLYKQKIWIAEDGEHKYSNLGYCLLGEVIAKKTGKDYRKGINEILDLKEFGISFSDAPEYANQVRPDYRYHDFYRDDLRPKFDYYAISSTAGMMGSASSYAKLIKYILSLSLPGFLTEKKSECNDSEIRRCYGNAFYLYQSPGGKYLNIKEGYMPGFSGVVVVNEKNDVFVWLGNSDTPEASEGKNMKRFIDVLSETDF